jgi:NNP family nitrate/nitrite transporter-like MFS transporter
MLGGLGGFFLPKVFGWLGRATGFPQAAFLALLALTVGSLVWLHLAIWALRKGTGSAAGLVSSPARASTLPELRPLEN